MIQVQESLKGGPLYPLADSSEIRGGLLVADELSELSNIRKAILIEGQLAYIKSLETYYKYNSDNKWEQFKVESLYVNETEPEDTSVLWLDTSTVSEKNSNPTLKSIQQALDVLEKKIEAVSLLRTCGVVSGEVTDSTLNDLSQISDPLKPDIIEDDPTKDDGRDDTQYPTTTPSATKTINHISIKMGKYDEMKANKRNFIDGEMCWATDTFRMYIFYNGAFYPIGSTGSVNPDDNDDKIMTKEELQKLLSGGIDSINFTNIEGDVQYTVKVNSEGNLQVYDISLDNRISDPGSNGITKPILDFETSKYASVALNSFYLGGSDSDEHSYQPCSHNFVELSNIDEKDINLNGLLLIYFDGTNTEVLPLWGKIPAQSTFLVRGAQCSVMDVNTTIIKVNTYDMEWFNQQGDLIKFNRSFGKATFYLAWGEVSEKADGTTDYNIYMMLSQANNTGTKVSAYSNFDSSVKSDNKISNNDTEGKHAGYGAAGFQDLVGVGNDSLAAKNPINGVTTLNSNQLFVKWYSLDPVSQSNPKAGLSGLNNKKYWKWINLDGSFISDLERFTPKASWEGKNASSDKTQLSKTRPNCITCNFGIQASDDSGITYENGKSGKGATRCFTWTSVNYEDEYVAYRIKGSNSDYTYVESYKDGVDYTKSPQSTNQPECICTSSTYWKYYTRKRWETFYGEPVTTHKVMITNLKAGIYEYVVCRKNSDGTISDYKSPVRYFTVKSYNDCKNFDFIQTTDQQGANWEEYQVWAMASMYIAKKHQTDVNNLLSDSGINLVHSESGDKSAQPSLVKDGTVIFNDDFDFTINTGDVVYNGSRPNEWLDYFNPYEEFLGNKEENFAVGNNDLAPFSMRSLGNGSETPDKSSHIVADLFYTQEIDIENPPVFTGTSVHWEKSDSGSWSMTTRTTTKQFRIPCLYSFNYGPWHFISLNSEIRTGNTETAPNTVTGDNEDGGEFGVKDVARDFTKMKYPDESEFQPTDAGYLVYQNAYPLDTTGYTDTTVNAYTAPSAGDYDTAFRASYVAWLDASYKEARDTVDSFNANPVTGMRVYDYVEAWMEKDLYTWKNREDGTLTIPTEQSNELIETDGNVDSTKQLNLRKGLSGCKKCIVFTHESPFTIIAQSTYDKYSSHPTNTWRETGKANLNRKHAFEFQRLFKMWGISCLFGGHKHTCSISYPVYDAPMDFNPITSQDSNGVLKTSSDITKYMSALTNSATMNPITQLDMSSFDAQERLASYIASTSRYQATNEGSLSTGIIFNNSGKDVVLKAGDYIVNNSKNEQTSVASDITFKSGKVYNVINGNVTEITDLSDLATTAMKGSSGTITLYYTSRLELVNSISAPVYVMCQATGYKIKSNSDLMGAVYNGWLQNYVPGTAIPGDDSVEYAIDQFYPFFTRVNCNADDNTINVSLFRIDGLNCKRKGVVNSKAGYWDVNIIMSEGDTYEERRDILLNKCSSDIWGTTQIKF